MQNKIKILYMEDNLTFAHFIKKNLLAEGYLIEVAENGELGLIKLQHQSFDLVIIDYLMPKLNGLQVLQKISQDYPKMIKIMLTGAGDENLAVEAMKYGADDYIVKDTGKNLMILLRHTIKRHLDQAKLLQDKAYAEKKLKENSKQLIGIFNQSYQCMLLMQYDGNIITINERAKKIMGLQSDEQQHIKNTNFYQCIGDSDRKNIDNALSRAIQGKVTRFEIKLTESENQEIPLDITFKPIYDNQGKISMIVCEGHDISAHKAAEDKLSQAQNMVAMLSKAKDQFLSITSHELRTPLAAIVGYTELLKDEIIHRKDFHYLKDIEKISLASKQLKTLVNDILVLAKAQSGLNECSEELFDIYLLITSILQEYEAMAAEKQLELKSNISQFDKDNRLIFANRIKMKHIIINLLINAIKFTQQGGIHLTLHIGSFCDSEKLIIKISDSGVGIAEDIQEDIFLPFNQKDGSTTRKHGGTGLGLSVVKQLVTGMKGAIELTSKINQGTAFTVTLPINQKTLKD